MSSRIAGAFGSGKAFVGFVTAGDPDLESTVDFVLAMERGGAALVELGIPFSDPIAEGVVIQDANLRALRAGFRIEDIFTLTAMIREKSQIPLVYLGYANPVFRYGYSAFFARAKESGADGAIIADLPYEEAREAKPYAMGCGIDLISLIAPTSKERIAQIAGEATGFVYAVSSMGVTGIRSEVSAGLKDMVGQIKRATDTPVAVGFGIHTPEQAAQIAEYADGVIVGSAIVRLVEEHGADAAAYIEAYVAEMKGALAFA